jgi:hypothetical protein
MGRTYRLESVVAFPPDGAWQTVSNNLPGNGGTSTAEVSDMSITSRFYRVCVEAAAEPGVLESGRPRKLRAQ